MTMRPAEFIRRAARRLRANEYRDSLGHPKFETKNPEDETANELVARD